MRIVDKITKERPKKFKVMGLKLASTLQLEVVDGMEDLVITGNLQSEKEMAEEYESIQMESDYEFKEQYQEHLIELNYINSKVLSLVNEMQIIALYKMSEIAIYDMCKISDLFEPDEIRNFYRQPDLVNAFKEKVYDMREIDNYDQYNELRLINNCIKHSGQVSKQLSEVEGWNMGEPLQNLGAHYLRLRDPCRDFIINIRKKIIDKLNEGSSQQF